MIIQLSPVSCCNDEVPSFLSDVHPQVRRVCDEVMLTFLVSAALAAFSSRALASDFLFLRRVSGTRTSLAGALL